MSKYTKEILLSQLKEYYKLYSKTPKQPNTTTAELACYTRFKYHFGSWKQALKEAEIPLHYECHEPIQTHCAYCNIPVTIQYARYHSKTRKTKNVFCSKSHAGKYNSINNPKHKTYRSKLEIFVYDKLTKDFPDLDIKHNNKSIGYELDLYIPSLKLAFEFNGPLHYRPIYGEDKLLHIQERDEQRITKCKSLNIDLHILDVSNQTTVNPNSCTPFYLYVKEQIIKKK